MHKRLLPEENGETQIPRDWRGAAWQFLDLIPPHWKTPLDQPDPFLEVTFGADGVAISVIRHRQAQLLLQLPRTGSEGPARFSPSETKITSAYPKAVSLILPQSECLHRTVEMPMAKPSALKAALAFELDRISPIDPSLVYFDFEIVSRDPKSGKAKIDLRIVKRESVEKAVAWCHGASFQVGAIGFTGEDRKAVWSSFPLDKRAFLHLLWLRWSISLLAGLAVLLLILSLAAGYARSAAAQTQIENDIATERSRAALSSRTEAEIRQTAAEAAYLQLQKNNPTVIAMLSDLTAALPDSTWLNELQVNGRHLRMQGYSKSASDLIAILEKTGKFASAQFAAPLTRTNDTDRFDLSVDWKGTGP